jgi:hypothetical protein
MLEILGVIFVLCLILLIVAGTGVALFQMYKFVRKDFRK